MNQKLVLFTFFLLTKICICSVCVTDCSSAFRDRVLWNSDGRHDLQLINLTSFHGVISSSDSYRTAARRIGWACEAVNEYDRCLTSCEDCRERSLRLISNRPWKAVCQAANYKNFSEFLSCQWTHINRVQDRCGDSENVQFSSIAQFCRSLAKYKKCYNRIARNCTKTARKIWEKVDNALSDTYKNLLWLNANKTEIPKKCNWLTQGQWTQDSEEDLNKEVPGMRPSSSTNQQLDRGQIPKSALGNGVAQDGFVDYWVIPNAPPQSPKGSGLGKSNNFYSSTSKSAMDLSQDKRSVVDSSPSANTSSLNRTRSRFRSPVRVTVTTESSLLTKSAQKIYYKCFSFFPVYTIILFICALM